LDGKKIAKQIQAEIREEVAAFKSSTGVVPVLAAVLAGDDPASQVYVRNKQRACQRVGIDSRLIRLPSEATSQELLAIVEQLNHDDDVSGILVQLPLPSQIADQEILDAIDPRKDVDGFHASNVGLMMQGRPRFLSCTPLGILQILFRSQIPVSGKHVCVLGRSDIVGKPMAAMLMQKEGRFGPEYANATVTVCHSRTRKLPAIARSAEILVAAIGQPGFVTAEMVQPGATVIDVGINRVDQQLVGDVDFASVSSVAGAITPVPGGVGPLTVTMLLANTLQAARERIDSVAMG
jgi:methylenetetrahydrofolate dehydrogenase (NADP+)/methenyltetrahydrofolate cyclohydrolase